MIVPNKEILSLTWHGEKCSVVTRDASNPLNVLRYVQVWCLAVSRTGDFVITGSHDRSVRRWEKTDEPFFIDEEKERRLESLFEGDEGGAAQRRPALTGEDAADGVAEPAGKKSQVRQRRALVLFFKFYVLCGFIVLQRDAAADAHRRGRSCWRLAVPAGKLRMCSGGNERGGKECPCSQDAYILLVFPNTKLTAQEANVCTTRECRRR